MVSIWKSSVSVVGATLVLSSCAYVDSSDHPIDGYVLVATKPYRGASSFKYYVAPESKAKIKLQSRSPVTNQVETIDLTTISIGKAYPQGGVKYFVEGYACDLDAGTFVPKKSNSSDWDSRYQTEAYGTVTWKIWKYVCNK